MKSARRIEKFVIASFLITASKGPQTQKNLPEHQGNVQCPDSARQPSGWTGGAQAGKRDPAR